jgi:hypothetical protein
MYRSIKAINADMVKCATKRWPADEAPKDWDGLLAEFQEVVGFWGRVGAVVNPKTIITHFDEWAFTFGSLQPEDMIASRAALSTLMSVNGLTTSEWFCLRTQCTEAAKAAFEHDDMDEVIWVARDFLIREAGAQPNDRKMVDRKCRHYECDPFQSDPPDGYCDDEAPLHGFEGADFYCMSSGECRMFEWWEKLKSDMGNSVTFRARLRAPALAETTYKNVLRSLAPLLSCDDPIWRRDLYDAATCLLELVKIRTQGSQLRLKKMQLLENVEGAAV